MGGIARYLLIVAQDQLNLRDYWTQWFAAVQGVQVILDRRLGERRTHVQPYEPERRRDDRRYQPGIDRELRSSGFAISPRRRRILVVEDNEIVRDAVAMMLFLDHYEIDTASNRAEALGLLERRVYDVIVSDLGLPNVDIPMFYQELKQRRPDALQHLIFMTGHTDNPEYASFLKETRVPVLAKPFTPEDLRQAVERALSTP